MSFRTIVAEETTTLPEGARVSMVRAQYSSALKMGTTRTELVAKYEDYEVIMKVDDVQAPNLRQYLDLMVRQIDRLRSKALEATKEVSEEAYDEPKKLDEFVCAMAARKMFLREKLT